MKSNARANAPARDSGKLETPGEPAKSRSHAAAGTRSHARAKSPPKGARPILLGGAGVVVVAILVAFLVFRGKEESPASAAEPVAAIDLSSLIDRQPLEGTTDEEWAAMNELMTRYRTPPFGPASVQSGDRLMIQGRRVVPAILNGFKRLDLTTKDGAEIGWKIQTLLLQGLCGDTNFGWRRETGPADVASNQQVIQRWFEAWEAAGMDDDAWAEISRLKAVPPGLAKGSDSEKKASED